MPEKRSSWLKAAGLAMAVLVGLWALWALALLVLPLGIGE
jgi:hypothetical protein